MFKSKVAVTAWAFAAVLLLAGAAFAGIIDPCQSSVSPTTASGCLNVCPAGDGTRLDGLPSPVVLTVTVLDNSGQPIEGILWSDLWLIDCDPLNDLCLNGGSASSNADDNTDANGQTTISGTMSVGGYAQGISVVVQGFVIQDPANNCEPVCISGITVVSADVDKTGDVSAADNAFLGLHFPPNPYDAAVDYNCDGSVSPSDQAFLALHFGHVGQACVTP